MFLLLKRAIQIENMLQFSLATCVEPFLQCVSFRVTTLGKLFTPTCLCHQAV